MLCNGLSRKECNDLYESVLRDNDAKSQRRLCLDDLFYLLTMGFKRPDVDRDWLYERVREVEASPDGHLDLWSREHYKNNTLRQDIFTPTGWRKFGDLAVGDYVFSPTGKPVKVLAMTPINSDPNQFKLTFSTFKNDINETIQVGSEHMWRVQVRKVINGKEALESKDLSTQEIVKYTTNQMKNKNECWFRVEASKAFCSNYGHWYINMVERAVTEPARCIQVEGGAYVVGKNNIPTLNSTIITFGLSIRDILRDPDNTTIGIFSHTRPIAKGFLEQIKRELESNEYLKSLFPDILYGNPRSESPKWSLDSGIIVKRKTNPKESTCEAWGLVDGQPTGKHFSHLIYDDVVTRESVTTSDQIKKVTGAIELSYNLGAKGGYRRFIGTRYHVNDTYRVIMDRGTAKPRIYAATHNGKIDGEPVFMTKKELSDKRRDMGPFTFGCFPPGAPVLMEDWTEKAIQDIKIGDKLVGYCFEKGKKTKLVPSTVLDVNKRSMPVYEAVLESGRIVRCTKEHRWYTGRRGIELGGCDSHRTYGKLGFEKSKIKSLVSIYDPRESEGIERILFNNGTRNFGKTKKDGLVSFVDLGTSEVFNIETETGNYVCYGYATKNSQMLQDPVADKAMGFKEDWLSYYNNLNHEDFNRYILVDPASDKKKTSDYSVFAVIGLAPDQNYYLIDMVRDRMNLTEKANTLFKLHRLYKPLKVGYEEYGMQSDIEHMKYVMDQENYRFNIQKLGGLKSKEDRIKRLIPIFEQKRFYLPTKLPFIDYEGRMVDLSKSFVDDEYISFPVSVHDDMLDCIARIVDVSFGARFPIEEVEQEKTTYTTYGSGQGWMS